MYLALLFDTWPVKVGLIALYVAILVTAWALEILLAPVILNLVLAATARRPLVFMAAAAMTSPVRKKVRKAFERLCTWWSSIPRHRRRGVIAFALFLLVLCMLEAYDVFGLVPFPMFAALFFRRELPQFFLRFCARQGVDTFIFRGGWHLCTGRMQKWIQRRSYRVARKIIGVRRQLFRSQTKRS